MSVIETASRVLRDEAAAVLSLVDHLDGLRLLVSIAQRVVRVDALGFAGVQRQVSQQAIRPKLK